MAIVQGRGGIDDGGGWAIAASFPLRGIDGRPFGEAQYLGDNGGQAFNIAQDWQEEFVVLWRRGDELDGSPGSSGDQNWCDKSIVAGFVEVLQVQGVVPDLVGSVGREFIFTDLEFENKDDRADEDDDIDAFPQPGDGIFKINFAAKGGEDGTKNGDLFKPGIALGGFEGERIVLHEFAENRRWRLAEEYGKGGGIERAVHEAALG